MIVGPAGPDTPFAFAGTGDELVVAGTMSNAGNITVPTIFAAAAGNTVTNNGVISGVVGIDTIRLDLGGTIKNNGVIAGVIATSGALTFGNDGTFVGYVMDLAGLLSLGSTITNKGTMTYSGFWHIAADPVSTAVISLGGGNDTVINSGKVLGDINLGGGSNTYDGRGGVVAGTVFGGTGNDSYWLTGITAISDSGGIDTVYARMTYTLGTGLENLTLSGFGNFSGTGNTSNNVINGNSSKNVLTGLGGADSLSGFGGNDTLDGGTGNDSLDGGGGSDRLIGGYGNDALLGGDASDNLTGDTGNDTLLGGGGADVLAGGIGGDSIDGGDGADLLIGGAFGTDTMTGGAGADRFVFLVADDSFANKTADVITDFGVGADKIDLSALIDGTFGFVGAGPFSLGAPSVRAIAGAGGNTVVQIDMDGNATYDMQIYLTGSIVLTVDSFVL